MAGIYLSVRIYHGLAFRTDLMALLPRDEQSPQLQEANDTVTRALSRRIIILVGHVDRSSARAAAQEILKLMNVSGLIENATSELDENKLKQIGKFYYPYRAGLLSYEDSNRLKTGKAQEIVTRALSEVFGGMGLANSKLLHDDPFLLMPSYLSSLPIPLSCLSLDDGMLSLEDEGMTWVFVSAKLKGEPFALEIQKRMSDVYDRAVAAEGQAYPGLKVLHLGAVFFAAAGAEEAMHETATIGLASTLGTVIFIIVMFRAIRPLVLNLLVIGVGIMSAMAASLFIFGELHVGALLFGVSLIGVAVDYGLQYCCEIFASTSSAPGVRLKRVFGGITLGTATSVIGYLTLLLAPFPGLHQIAIFSATGLIAAWLTVVFWLPPLDRKDFHRPQPLATIAAGLFDFWQRSDFLRLRWALLGALTVMGFIGYLHFRIDDDVRHMQSLSPSLVREQEHIQKLIGATTGSQFIIVDAADDETALQNEEKLSERLRPLMASGALAGFQSPSDYVPSIARQRENLTLQKDYLYRPLLGGQASILNLRETPLAPGADTRFVTLADVRKSNGALPFLSALLLDNDKDHVTHMVSLDGVSDLGAVRATTSGIPGVRLVDPVDDFSRLLGKYRSRAIILVALSALLMAPLLMCRYGILRGLWIMVPSSLAVFIAPALRALLGGAFTFFDAMALVLVLSIGVDYAVFCAETSHDRRPVTMLAVAMAASTALMSFGLLALSRVLAVHNFGMTMLIGILLSFLFAPMVRLVERKKLRSAIGKISCLIFLFVLCSCAGTLIPSDLKPVSISPDVSVVLPDPASLGRSVVATQLVTAHYGDKSFAFEAHIEATQKHFLMVGLDMVGRKMITIEWTKGRIDYKAATSVPPQIRPENILADMVLIYWPPSIVRESLALSSGTLIENAHARTIMFGKTSVLQVDYQSLEDAWAGTLHYRNLARDYAFDIQSVEDKP